MYYSYMLNISWTIAKDSYVFRPRNVVRFDCCKSFFCSTYALCIISNSILTWGPYMYYTVAQSEVCTTSTCQSVVTHSAHFDILHWAHKLFKALKKLIIYIYFNSLFLAVPRINLDKYLRELPRTGQDLWGIKYNYLGIMHC